MNTRLPITIALFTAGVVLPAMRAGGADLTHTVIGGGGDGAPVAVHGRWTFDILSDPQRAPSSSCDNTVFGPFGEWIVDHGWQPSPQSTLPASVQWSDPAGSQAIGGGVLSFASGVYPPLARSVMQSPIIPAPLQRIGDGDFIELSFTARSVPVAPSIAFIAGFRAMHGGVWGPWEEIAVPVLPGENEYRVSFTTLVGSTTEATQVALGIQNEGEDEEVVPIEAPEIDDVTEETTTTGERVTHNVPDISQGNTATCAASAFANCLSWWGNNGYSELTHGETQEEKNENLKDDLIDFIYDQDLGTYGVTKYLEEQGVYKDQEETDERPQLEHVGARGSAATWDYLKEQFDAGHDVLLRVQWYDAAGDLVDPDAAHFLTVAQVRENEDGTKTILVSNPWGPSHHSVSDGDGSIAAGNKAEAYDTLDATCDEDGRIRIDNTNLEQNAAGIDGADHLCVSDINVVRPVSSGSANRASNPSTSFAVTMSTAPGGDVIYDYTITNLGTDPLVFVALDFEVPWSAPLAPAGWSVAALPAAYPGGGGCGSFMGGTGVAWSTDANPIAPGEALNGFSVTVPAAFPLLPFSIGGATSSLGFFAHELAPAPAPIPGDLDSDGDVDFTDLVQLLAAWGPCAGCPEDLDGNGSVGFSDLVIMLANWG